MKVLKKSFIPTIIMASCVLTACIDDNYDLENIDTTARITVNSLTIPINLDEIYLKTILDTANNELRLIDGKYTFDEAGHFESNDVRVDQIVIGAPQVSDTHHNIDASNADEMLDKLGSATLSIATSDTHFSYTQDNITPEIISIDDIGTDLRIDFCLKFNELDNLVSAVTFSDITLKLPKGLTIDTNITTGTYDPATGIFVIKGRKVQGTSLNVTIEATKLSKESGFKFENHSFTLADNMQVVEGYVTIDKADLKLSTAHIPSVVSYDVSYNLSDIKITSISGQIQCNVSDIDIPMVNISSIPKFLADEETNISLENPQLYLRINNPASPWMLSGTTGLSITPYRHGDPGSPFILEPSSLVIPPMATPTTNATFCISPARPEQYQEGFADATHVSFPSLSNILSGNGLPGAVAFKLLSPMILPGKVVDFPIGVNLGRVKGDYMFYTPMALKEGSKIYYYEEDSGWLNDDLEKLVVTRLHVRANVDSDAPLALHFVVNPLDKNGEIMPNVEVKGCDVDAYAKNQAIDIYVTGELKMLDGVIFKAIATSQDPEVLDAGMNIKLNNLKVIVSGYYTTSF